MLTPTNTAAPNFVVRRDNDIGGFTLARNGTLGAAIEAFGTPTNRQPFESQAGCTVVWREFGIRTNFSHIVSMTPCDSRGCHTDTTITNRQWKTDKGLRVGDSLRRLRQLYPRTKPFVLGSWTLISRPLAGVRLPTLLAAVKNGRVNAFVIRSPWLLSCS